MKIKKLKKLCRQNYVLDITVVLLLFKILYENNFKSFYALHSVKNKVNLQN